MGSEMCIRDSAVVVSVAETGALVGADVGGVVGATVGSAGAGVGVEVTMFNSRGRRCCGTHNTSPIRIIEVRRKLFVCIKSERETVYRDAIRDKLSP